MAEANFPDAAGIGSGFDRYRSSLAQAGALDFDEQIYRAIEILVTQPDAREVVRTRCRYLLVDEFQDLNPGSPAPAPAAVGAGFRLLRSRRR